HGDDQAFLGLSLGLGVELLAELHDVHALLTQRGPDGGRGVRLAGGNLELDLPGDLLHGTAFRRVVRTSVDALSHGSADGGAAIRPVTCITEAGERGRPSAFALPSPKAFPAEAQPLDFSTCMKSRSTGVARPKIETSTLIRPFSALTSSTEPLKFANGPSMTRTVSPTSKRTLGVLFSAPSLTWEVRRATSESRMGSGCSLPVEPRKPVTFGVFFTRWKVRSFISICTKM